MDNILELLSDLNRSWLATKYTKYHATFDLGFMLVHTPELPEDGSKH